MPMTPKTPLHPPAPPTEMPLAEQPLAPEAPPAATEEDPTRYGDWVKAGRCIDF